LHTQQFFSQLEDCIVRYDLLTHPFYQAWSRGELTQEDLRQYAQDYYHHVDSFPRYLAEFARRLPNAELRCAVLRNLGEEVGGEKPSHSDLWLDFAEAMGARPSFLGETPASPIRNLVTFFHRVAKTGTPEQVLAAFYVYESQVPRIAQEKLRGLRDFYGASEQACQYFAVHVTEDVRHSDVWRQQLETCIRSNPSAAGPALRTAEAAAWMLWESLDRTEYQSLDQLIGGDMAGMV
jgi:pyrroloquinoline-quinone synthase